MRSRKGSRRIVVEEVEYRWKATGNDGYILIGIWPTNKIGPFIVGNTRYHETWIKKDDGSLTSAGNQIIVTNRLIRRIIEYAVASCGYDPLTTGNELNLKVMDEIID